MKRDNTTPRNKNERRRCYKDVDYGDGGHY